VETVKRLPGTVMLSPSSYTKQIAQQAAGNNLLLELAGLPELLYDNVD
jgi:hypothetical protein